MKVAPAPGFYDSDPLDIAPPHTSGGRKPFAQISLFWRTFFLISILLTSSTLAWLQTLRALEFEPLAIQTAELLVSKLKLSQTALMFTDDASRASLIKTLKKEEGLRIVRREATDTYDTLGKDRLSRQVIAELGKRLGMNTVVAKNMNGQPGMWVSFVINGDNYWLQSEQLHFNPTGGATWLLWLIVATVLSLAGAAAIACLINRPLQNLSFAASRMQEGDFDNSHLDESVNTSEIREVNIGFNRMAQKLAKVEQDRALMLAGISHDLRTPLARLRLETELSVSNEEARNHMVSDISQLDAIIDKFLDYARPDRVSLDTLALADVLDKCIYSIGKLPDANIQVAMDKNILVHADETELIRVITNLLENARRYGKTASTGVAEIHISAAAHDKWVNMKIRDHGAGVPPEQLHQLTQPFFRGEAARTAANGAGLGLSIVLKTMQRMGGALHITNAPTGGLSANLRLKRANRL